MSAHQFEKKKNTNAILRNIEMVTKNSFYRSVESV